MKSFLKIIIKHIISIFLATAILISFAAYPTSYPWWESLGWLYMNLISKMLVDTNLWSTDWTVKKAEKLVNNNSNCWLWQWLQWFDSNWNKICVTLNWTPTPINWLCSSTPWVCSIWTKINDNNSTTCWTTRTWQCQWSWWWTTASCTYNNWVCAPTYTYSWITWTWSTCSVSCGWWIQTRTVICRRSDWTTVSDSNCTWTKPSTTQTCNTHTCVTYSSCTLPWWWTIQHWSSVIAYASNSVSCSWNCTSQSRVCNNWSLSWTYWYSSCSKIWTWSSSIYNYTVNNCKLSSTSWTSKNWSCSCWSTNTYSYWSSDCFFSSWYWYCHSCPWWANYYLHDEYTQSCN